MKYIAILILSLVVLAGCGGSNQGSTSSSDDPWIGGTDGLIISFEEDAPLSEVYDGGDFPFGVVVKLKNEGEHEVKKEDVHVTISGILASEFGKTETELSLNPEDDLLPKRKDADDRIEESEPIFVDFGDFNFNSSLVAQQDYTFRADVCYTYQTTANSLLCVLKDNLDSDDALCTVTETKDIFNSGAPIQISEFKESAIGKNKIAFTFLVEHKGNGEIFEQGSVCNSTSREFEDQVWVEVSTGLDGTLECTGLRDGTATTGYIRLFSNSKPVRCTQEITTNSDYQQPVVINLRYDYEDDQETSVLVKHLPNG